MLTIGPCFAIPRTATTSFEMMVAPFVPSSYGWLAQLIYSLVFFTLAFLFAQHPEKDVYKRQEGGSAGIFQ